MPEKFTVFIPVKPYVKQFIVDNYGTPADFTTDTESNLFFHTLLKKPDTSRDKSYPERICTYTETIEVLLSQHVFYKYGWEISRTGIVAFNKRFENRAKMLMRNFVGVYDGIGLPINISIEKFQDRFGFEEEAWKYEAIKKDYYRNGNKNALDFNKEIFEKIEKIILRNMYDLGTISKKGLKEYETA